MASIPLDEDSIDEILYLARVNEASELSEYLTSLSTQTKHSKAELVAAAVDPYSKNSALHYAAANGHSDIIKLLLSYATDQASSPAAALINALNDAGNTALHWAALNGHLESVKLLIQSGADVTIINKAGHDAVFEAELNDKKEIVDWLLEEVEELEKAFGQTDEASAEAGEEDGAESDDKTNSKNVGEASEVDEVRRQIEGLKTKDGAAHGG